MHILFCLQAYLSHAVVESWLVRDAKAQRWDVVRWIIRDHNFRTRGFYDKLAEKTDLVPYEMLVK